MQRWQEKKRQRIHDSIVQNAKPTIKLMNSSNRSKQKMSTSRSKQFHKNITIKNNNSLVSFLKILQLFQLQKYQQLLIQNGFPHKLKQKKSNRYIDKILEQVQEQDQQRFLSLMNTLVIMSKDIQKNNSKKQISQNQISIKNRNNRTPNIPPPPSSSILRKSINNFSNNVTNNFASSKNTSQKAQQFRVKQHSNNFKITNAASSHQYLSSKFTLSNKPRSISKGKQQKSSVKKNNQKLTKTPTKKVKNHKVFDDIYITHDFKHNKNGQPTKITNNNKIIEKLIQKLDQLKPNPKKSNQQLGLNLQQIKKMYLSFDSVTLTSNIVNIDLQQIIDCFAQEIFNLIQIQVQKDKKTKTKASSRPPRPLKQFIQLQQEQQIKYLLKQSLILPNNKSQHYLYDGSFNPENIDLENSKLIVGERINTSQLSLDGIIDKKTKQAVKNTVSQKQQAQFQKQQTTSSVSINQIIQQSDDIYGKFSKQSFFSEDFSCFNSRSNQSLRLVEKTDIKNFIQLVIMAGKMQKQIPIFANSYINSLLKTDKVHPSKRKLTLINWRNIVLISLIQASKIWDDRSLENHSFSKVMPTYSTYEINRLEKYFLYYIDYQLTVNQKKYCQSYFSLRIHSKCALKTAHLMSLDLKKIQTLQSLQPGIKKKQIQLKQFYRKKMDKSF